MSKRLIGKYRNGTYQVMIFSDGTKVRMAPNDIFRPAFAENCDIKITDKCDGGCKFCYEGCTVNGKHGDILNAKFIDTLHPFTELALNGNDLTHPDLLPFLEKLQKKQVIANMTVNQLHFVRHYDFIKELISKKLIFGLGVSLVSATPEFVEMVKPFPNLVIHVINGILSEKDVNILKNNGLKVLILGYKQLRRGVDFYEEHSEEVIEKQKWLYNYMEQMSAEFEVVSFDNLAIEQLEIKRLMSDEDWEEFYMGDDGTVTFYIDLVDNKFAKNSLSQERYDLLDNIDDMFNVILERSQKKAS